MGNIKEAIFGGGCFWCTEAVFQQFKGIHSVTSGYSGGHVEHPTYRQICGQNTGHAEVIKIKYDEDVISYEELLTIFWTTHDPTTPNRQGNDKGPQYRSVVYYSTDEEKAIVDRVKQEVAQPLWNDPIVTEIGPLINYYEAEQEHQDFYKKHGSYHGYCTYVITPKISKARMKFSHLLL